MGYIAGNACVHVRVVLFVHAFGCSVVNQRNRVADPFVVALGDFQELSA